MRHFFTRVSSVLNTLLFGLSFLLSSTISFSQNPGFPWSIQAMNSCYCSYGRCGSLVPNPGFEGPTGLNQSSIFIDVDCWRYVNGASGNPDGSPHLLDRDAPDGYGFPVNYFRVPFTANYMVDPITPDPIYVDTWDESLANEQMVCMNSQGEQIEVQLMESINASNDPAQYATLDFWVYSQNSDSTFTHNNELYVGLSDAPLSDNDQLNWWNGSAGTIGFLSTTSDNCDTCRKHWMHIVVPITYSEGPALNFLRIGPSEHGWMFVDDVNVFIPNPPMGALASTQDFVVCGNDPLDVSEALTTTNIRCPIVWSPTDGVSVNSNSSVSLHPSQSTVYTVSTTDPCYADVSIPIELDFPTISVTVDPNPVCLGLASTLSVVESNSTYAWSGSDILGPSSGQTITVNPIASESYTVEATNSNGCIATATAEVDVQIGCCSALPPPSYTISGTVHWYNQTYEFDEDLHLLPHSSLFAHACTLKFSQGKGIILDESARLNADQSYLTVIEGCDGFWTGIFASHPAAYDNSLSLSSVYLKSTIIEKASIGVQAQTTNVPPQIPNQYHNWISIFAQDSKFINNKQAIKVIGAPGSVVCNSATLQLKFCTSITDLDFPVGHLPNLNHLEISNLLSTTRIEKSGFYNLNPVFLGDIQVGEFTAVKAFNANLYVFSNAVNSDGLNSGSRISGFTRGIRAEGKMNLSVNGTDFANWRSIYTRAKGGIKITDSDFENLPLTLLPAGNQIYVSNGFITPEGTENTIASPYGIYIDQSKAPYFIFDCTFQTELNIPNPPLSHGIIANDTGDINNRIRRNDFSGMDRALKIQGDNRTNNNLFGLRYSCNDFTNNVADIQELESTGTSSYYWGVPHQFSNQSWDPKNTFSENSSVSYFDDIHNASTHTHNYLKLPNSASFNPVPTECDGVLFQQSPSNLSYDQCLNENGLVLSNDNNTNTLVAQKNLLASAYDELSVYYRGIIDGGETTNLVSNVESANFANALSVYYSLMEKAPFLSEDVLVKALRNCNIPNYLLAQILASNPFAAKSEILKEEVSARPIPFEQYEKEQINEGLSIWSGKEQMEATLASYIADRDYLIREIFWRMDTLDSVPNFNAKLAMLDETKYPSDHLWKMSVLEDMADYSGAMVTLANAEILLKDLNIEMDAMLNDALEVEDNYSQNGTLDESDITTLFRIMKEGSATSYSKALDLLIQDGQIDYTEPIEEEGNSLRTMKTKTEQNAMLYSFDVYPNPASSAIVLDLHGVATDKVEIRSATGQLLLDQSLTLGQNKHQILLDNLNSGVYEVRLIDSRTKKLYCKSLIVNK